MIYLDGIIDPDHLRRMIDIDMVRSRPHSTEPLDIYNYTEKCQWSRTWNATTLQCRGLIVNRDTSQVVARPWPKFFNYGEYPTGPCAGARDERCGERCACFDFPVLDLDAAVRVYDKYDGSLGILYRKPSDGSWAIATRGSFESEQAVHATEMLREHHLWRWVPALELTYLFEIIYPENRVVVDYGRQRGLVLLDILETNTGLQAVDLEWNVPKPWAEELDAYTLREALALPPRKNAEGVVVRFDDTGLLLKVKQEDYVALHRIITGLNEKTVWEHLSAGKALATMLEGLPEEFHDWVLEVGGKLEDAYLVEDIRSYKQFCEIENRLHPDYTRKEFAQEVHAMGTDIAALLFLRLDGRDLAPTIWKSLKPRSPQSLRASSEDTA